jgi:excinuclease UvrABC ATPase subunit
MFLTCRFCQGWEFRAMKTQALYTGITIHSILYVSIENGTHHGVFLGSHI